MKGRRRKSIASVTGYALFFLTIAATVTVALMIYSLVDGKSGGNKALIAVIMLVVIVALSSLCTVIDVIRRKIMVEKPVNKILDATKKIAAGDFSVRLNTAHTYEKYDEYDLIMENLNAMAAQLGKSEILKNDFISNVSHELKTPLAVIQNHAYMLKKDGLDAQLRKKYADAVMQACKRLSNLVTNILKLNKLENQEIGGYEKIKLHEMLAQCVLQYESAIDDKHIELHCDFEEAEIVSSPANLEIVWNNLLSNAVKFTQEGGKISVSLKREGDCAAVEVSDSGCGISAENGARIFDKFYQGDTSHSFDGNGLGLALVKKVIDILGGEITVESQLNKGSTFRIVLKA